jgi:glycerol-3-phosphate dehydrogenase
MCLPPGEPGFLIFGDQMRIKTEVLIVGGGATGVGLARDLSMRGIASVLLEKGDFASGASGRNHGLLHSGGRYAVSDPEAARECMAENKVLRRIAPHCIEETGGLFVSLPEDGLEFRDRFLGACEQAEIPARSLSRDQALDREPGLSPDLIGAVEVPDGAIDPFTIVMENVRDAQERGAKLFPRSEVTSLIRNGNRVIGAHARDTLTGEEIAVEAAFSINATGAWANQFLCLGGIQIGMALSKGTLLVTNRRLTHSVINRCRPPSDGDIIVPNETVSILGTTSVRVEDVQDFLVTPGEVSLLVRQTSRMLPEIKETRLIRAYAGIRPLFQTGTGSDDRQISRGFALIDHGPRDGVEGLITVTGGKFITYRLMAEKAADLICEKMGIDVPCSTRVTLLSGAEKQKGLDERLQTIANPLSPEKGEIVCDCELIQRDEVEKVLKKEGLKNVQDILHRTRLAKGTCQGGFCIYRLLGVLHDCGMAEGDSNQVLKGFLEERWRGIRPVLWGNALKEEELLESIYKGIFNL